LSRKSVAPYKRLLVVTLGIALAGCVPFVTLPYYRPQAVEGRIAEANCPPAKSVWLFERDGIVVGARAEKRGDGMSIHMYFDVPAGKSAKLLSPNVEATTPDGTVWKGELSGSVMVSHGRTRKLEPGELLTGASRGLFGAGYSPYVGATRNELYSFTACVNASHAEELVVRLPPFLVNGVEQSVPEIVFRSDSEFHWIMPLNC
jgi:hypothetical protein